MVKNDINLSLIASHFKMIVYKVILKESHTKSRKEMLSEIRKTIRHKEHIKWFQSIVWLKIFIDSLKPLNNCPN